MAEISAPASGKVTPSENSGKKSPTLHIADIVGKVKNAHTNDNDLAVSRQSGKVTFPQNSARSGGSLRSLNDGDGDSNPFRMPPDNDIFMLRDKERQKKKQERIKQRSLRVHEKTTYATRVNIKTAGMIRPTDSDEEGSGSDDDDGRAVAVKDDPQFTLAVTRDRHVEKESLADYINKKREMFLVQYSLGVKRDEMRKLEEIAAAEEKKLEMAEQYLEEDAAMFDEFLKENDNNSVAAIRAAEEETKAKLEKVAEIKKINAQMMAIKSEISKYEDTLKEYQLYKKFLEALTPKDWLDDRLGSRAKRLEEKRRKREQEYREKKGAITPSEMSERGSLAGRGKKKSTLGQKPGAPSRSSTQLTKKTPLPGDTESVMSLQLLTDSDEDSDEEPELYFTDPHQLLDLFAELEEQNLSLIQNSQETEEALEEMKQMIKNTKNKMEKETEILKEQIDKLNNSIVREEEKAKDLEIKSRMFSYGEFKAEDQERMLGSLNKKVEEVYRSCIGDNEANISTLQMLTNIENRLEELFEMIEMMPQDKVEAAEKDDGGNDETWWEKKMRKVSWAKEKERRLKMREEKMEQQRIHQEERVRKALERAKADPKKTTGRRLVARSEPPRLKRQEDDGDDQRNREEEELAYFFTM